MMSVKYKQDYTQDSNNDLDYKDNDSFMTDDDNYISKKFGNIIPEIPSKIDSDSDFSLPELTRSRSYRSQSLTKNDIKNIGFLKLGR